VTIAGRGAPAPAPRILVADHAARTRSSGAAPRRPDRIAGWAALLGLVLVLVSVVSP
jgi:hypothetical protein